MNPATEIRLDQLQIVLRIVRQITAIQFHELDRDAREAFLAVIGELERALKSHDPYAVAVAVDAVEEWIITDDALLEPLYDLMGRVLAKAQDEFDGKLDQRDQKIANLQARLAEREDKQAGNFQRLQADLGKQIKRLTARLSEQERRHKREIEELRAKAAPVSSEIIGYGTSKTEYRIVPYKSNGRPGASINLRPLFERYFNETNQLNDG